MDLLLLGIAWIAANAATAALIARYSSIRRNKRSALADSIFEDVQRDNGAP